LPTEQRFHDRREAGEELARHLASVLEPAMSLVLGIPRGGVVVALPVAQTLGCPLDVIVPRKIGAPNDPELAIAALALAEGEDIVVRDEATIDFLGVTEGYLTEAVARERREIERRLEAYREGRPPFPLSGRRVLIVDDGIATGLTARAAASAVARLGPREVIVAAPVAPRDTRERFLQSGLRLETCRTPSFFHAVGEFYVDFHPVEDDEVCAVLRASAPQH
jgi:putative phosphoribosyl transferase